MGAATAEASNGVGTAGCGEVRDAGAAELGEGVDVGVDGDSVAGEHPAISATAPKTAAVAWMDRMPPILWFGFVRRFGIGPDGSNFEPIEHDDLVTWFGNAIETGVMIGKDESRRDLLSYLETNLTPSIQVLVKELRESIPR